MVEVDDEVGLSTRMDSGKRSARNSDISGIVIADPVRSHGRVAHEIAGHAARGAVAG